MSLVSAQESIGVPLRKIFRQLLGLARKKGHDAEQVTLSRLALRWRLRDDAEAREELFGAARPCLLRRLCAKGIPEQERENIVQNALLRAYRNYDPDGGALFSTYLYTTLNGAVLHYFRGISAVEPETLDADAEDETASNPGWENDEYAAVVELDKCIAKLPTRLREIFVAIRLHGKKNKEVADDLDLWPSQVSEGFAKAERMIEECMRRKGYGGRHATRS